MAKLRFLTTSKNDIQVYYDPEYSHVATHFADTPQLIQLAVEVIQKSIFDKERVEFDKDMGRIIGNSDLVENDPGDEIVYAIRKNRNTYSSFNKTKLPQPSSVVTISAIHQADGSYELENAWIGPLNSPPWPGDPSETAESKTYWTSHSLAWGTQEIQNDTLTDICPW